jgi:presenilin-like A22 family membrane protease
MNEKQILLLLVVIFLSVQALGLVAASQYISFIEQGIAEPVFEDPQAISNAIYIFIYILALTVILLLVIRYKKRLLVAFEGLAASSVLYL